MNGSDFKLLDRDWDAWAIFNRNTDEGTGEAGDQDTDMLSIPFEQVNRALLNPHPPYISADENTPLVMFEDVNRHLLHTHCRSTPSVGSMSDLSALSDSMDERDTSSVAGRRRSPSPNSFRPLITIRSRFDINNPGNKRRPYPLSNNQGQRDHWTQAQRLLAEHSDVPASLKELRTKVCTSVITCHTLTIVCPDERSLR